MAKGRVAAGGIDQPVPLGVLEIGREKQDGFAVESNRRALAAQQAGTFDEEIIPVTVNPAREM